MRGLVLFIVFVVIIIVSSSFIYPNIDNKDNQNVENKKQNKILEFSVFTSAVCENKADVVHCKDEVFVNCNGSISKATDYFTECNGIKFDVPKATGSAVFGNDWKDPRD